jgi:hypothetical protein
MDAGTVALLVTWIMPGGADQPNVINSYQSTFASVEACEAAGDKILQDAQRMNSEGRAKWDVYGRQAAGLLWKDVSVSAVCVGSDLKAKPAEPRRAIAPTPPAKHLRDTCGPYPDDCWTQPISAPGWDVFRAPYKMTTGEVTNAITTLEDKATYKWARIAAELGSAEAQAHLGIQLIGDVSLLPKEVTRDANEGLKWLNISAQHGCANALYYLSVTYQSMQNKVDGLKWAILAKTRKHLKECNMYFDKSSFDFTKFVDLSSDGMTTAQITEAQKLAREWKAADLLDRRAWENNEVRNGTRQRP